MYKNYLVQNVLTIKVIKMLIKLISDYFYNHMIYDNYY